MHADHTTTRVDSQNTYPTQAIFGFVDCNDKNFEGQPEHNNYYYVKAMFGSAKVLEEVFCDRPPPKFAHSPDITM